MKIKVTPNKAEKERKQAAQELKDFKKTKKDKPLKLDDLDARLEIIERMLGVTEV
jgi:hypothetical protein